MACALILSDNEFEDIELLYIYYRLIESGVNVKIASPSFDVILGEHEYVVQVDLLHTDVDVEGYDILILPGGKNNLNLRTNESVINLVKRFFESNKYIAASGLGMQVLISSGIMKGLKATSSLMIKDDLINSGATFINEKAVIDSKIISCRETQDLPEFSKQIINRLVITNIMLDRVGPGELSSK